VSKLSQTSNSLGVEKIPWQGIIERKEKKSGILTLGRNIMMSMLNISSANDEE